MTVNPVEFGGQKPCRLRLQNQRDALGAEAVNVTPGSERQGLIAESDSRLRSLNGLRLGGEDDNYKNGEDLSSYHSSYPLSPLCDSMFHHRPTV